MGIKIEVVNNYQEEGKYKGVPIFYNHTMGSQDIFMLIRRDEEDEMFPYKVISLDNGHVQKGCEYKSIDEFYNRNKGIKILDLDVKAIHK